MKDTVHVKGLAELDKFLKELPAKMEANVMRSALRAGAMVIRNEAKQNAPVATPNLRNMTRYGGYAGALRDSIRVSTRLSKGVVTSKITAGGKTKGGADVYYARWVEFGTAAHSILNRKKRGLFFGGRWVDSVEHPGARPKPFMRPAAETQSQAALLAVGEAIKKRLTKQGLEQANEVQLVGE